MGSSASDNYCAFTKAVERLGDRWSLLIVRELVLFGPQGFNALAHGLPGHISRSVLSDKLRKLEEMGIVARMPSAGGRPTDYLLTPVGEQLRPVIRALLGWAEKWVPEDPAMAQRDPGVIVWWLAHRVDTAVVPAHQVVIEIAMSGADVPRGWLLLARDTEPTLCAEDPLLSEDCYVYVDADPAGCSLSREPCAAGPRQSPMDRSASTAHPTSSVRCRRGSWPPTAIPTGARCPRRSPSPEPIGQASTRACPLPLFAMSRYS